MILVCLWLTRNLGHLKKLQIFSGSHFLNKSFLILDEDQWKTVAYYRCFEKIPVLKIQFNKSFLYSFFIFLIVVKNLHTLLLTWGKLMYAASFYLYQGTVQLTIFKKLSFLWASKWWKKGRKDAELRDLVKIQIHSTCGY